MCTASHSARFESLARHQEHIEIESLLKLKKGIVHYLFSSPRIRNSSFVHRSVILFKRSNFFYGCEDHQIPEWFFFQSNFRRDFTLMLTGIRLDVIQKSHIRMILIQDNSLRFYLIFFFSPNFILFELYGKKYAIPMSLWPCIYLDTSWITQ